MFDGIHIYILKSEREREIRDVRFFSAARMRHIYYTYIYMSILLCACEGKARNSRKVQV